MAFSSNLFGDTAHPAETHQGLVDIVSLSIAADGELALVEVETAVDFIQKLLGVSAEDANAFVDDTLVRLGQKSTQEALTEAVASLPLEEHREAAFLAAAWVQYVDGEVRTSEDVFLEELAVAMGLEEERAQEMISYVEANLDSE